MSLTIAGILEAFGPIAGIITAIVVIVANRRNKSADTFNKLQDTVSGLIDAVDDLRKQNDSLQERVAALETENRELRKENSDLRIAIAIRDNNNPKDSL